ncbi:DNA gyrase/topoisomerase IV subunit A [Zhihengliuella halotolerans]|uniref:DNA topoisomerase (ATP-hydrolyzing) n=1 Tax=Zhihengliuella halotolerans TaxID=370736 RepID=A0A4Q8AC29_9MICC|nr:DNA topoisomerase (ATP-hydrolyzing) [Zhihengliuella halotolerans]RZU61143.1 DNA gyrase subunit A [Zhihengliuella halotolerans]
MARRQSSILDEDFTENIVDVDVTSEMEDSFLEYAYSVIYSRALPDARDGLKPVQRRILYMMTQMGVRPDKGHVKSARVVGEVMGKLHPHGDGAIYDAMVRLAQPWAMRLPLVDGHGNFGSLDDGPAAARYTEARMDATAVAMTDNLDEDVVDFVPNYDNQLTQPDVLPSAFPNLLVNGTTGIAVGMATNMAPHNLGEVIAAARHLVATPEATLEDVMKFIPGPDLPGGGIIVGLDGIKDAYAKGRGSFKTRAKVALEQISARKKGLVVTELPYMVGPEKVIEKIKDAVTAKKLTGISDVVDLTDRKHGMRLVIELKNGFNPNAVLAQLFKFTPMEDSFGINNVALVDGQPRTMGLLELLQVYVGHRLDVVRRRTAFRLGKRRDRLHLVEGLLVAILDIDEVIQIIRTSDETAAARERLMKIYDLTEVQSNHILELRLRQLTKYSQIELEAERDKLKAEIEELEAILASDERLRDVVSTELADVAEKFATPRRTVLQKKDDGKPLKGSALPSEPAAPGAKTSVPLEIANDPCYVLLSASGQLARTADRSPLGETGPRVKHDAVRSLVPTTARGEVGALTSAGRLIRLQVVDMPVLAPSPGFPPLAQGVPVKEFATMQKGESVVAIVPMNEPFALGTAAGVVKRVSPDYPLNRDEFEAITLKDGDEVIGAGAARDDDALVFITRQARLLRFPAATVRPQGRLAGGMAGVKLAADDRALFFGIAADDDRSVVVTIASGSGALPGTEAGTVKVTPLAEYPTKGRATAGVRAHRFLKGEDNLSLAFAGPGPAKASSAAGVARALPTEHGRRDGSGVPLAQRIELLAGTVSGRDDAPEGDGAASESDSVLESLRSEEPRRAPLAAPEQDSIPFGDPGVVETD